MGQKINPFKIVNKANTELKHIGKCPEVCMSFLKCNTTF